MVFPNVNIKTFCNIFNRYLVHKIHFIILFNRSTITIILMHFSPEKSRFTVNQLWNRSKYEPIFYSVLVKIWKHRGIYFLTFCFFYTHNSFWRNVWRHLLSQANNNTGSKFRMFLFYLGALQLGHREIFK